MHAHRKSKLIYWLFREVIMLLCLTASVTSGLQGQMAIWDTRNSGTLDGTKFTFTNVYDEENSLYEWDYSNTKYFYRPLDTKERCTTYSAADNWHLSFDKKIKNLHLYIGVWRPGVYKFSVPFKLVSNSPNIKKIDNFIIIERSKESEGGNFGNAIVRFIEPTCCLFLESSLSDFSQQVMTFGVYDVQILVCGTGREDHVPPPVISLEKKRKDRVACRNESRAYPKKVRD